MEWTIILNELSFRTSRSSGAGGQHVNKTETKVEVLFHVMSSQGLSVEEKEMIQDRLGSRISEEGFLIYKSQKSRSQAENKEKAIQNLYLNLQKALKPATMRIKTKPTASSVEERLELKKRVAEKKVSRQKPRL